MSDWQKIFVSTGEADELGSDFEMRVFTKIKKKKRQRKVGFAVAALAGVALLLSLFQLFRPLPHRAFLPVGPTAKEEIPVSEDLFFSASDNFTRYSLEPVSYLQTSSRKVSAAEAAQAAALNQI